MANNILPPNHIRLLRVARSLSLRQLAARVNINYGTLSLIETGKQLPSPTHLNRLQAALEVDFDDPRLRAALDLITNGS